jgi:putative transposase
MSGVYYQPQAIDSRELAIKRHIDEVYTAYPFYGIRRITAQLRHDGMLVNHKAVARHMQEMGLQAIYPGPNLSKRAQQEAVYPYLLRTLTIEHPNHVWGGRHHLHPLALGLDVSIRGVGLVLALRSELGTRSDPGD